MPHRPRLLVAGLIVLSLQAVTVLALLDAFPSIRASPPAVLLIGIAMLVILGYLGCALFRACGCDISFFAILFAVTSWSAMVDLILALTLLDITQLGRFYLLTGEEYFKSSWGFFALLWDGTAHYVLQLYLAYATLLQRPSLVPGLFWCGSILNSMPVLLLGGATGSYSNAIKPSTALNAPYVLAPLAYLRSLHARSAADEVRAQPSSSSARLQSQSSSSFSMAAMKATAWASYHMCLVALHAWRSVAALGSAAPAARWWVAHLEPILGATTRPSHGFVRVQCLVHLFYYVPFHVYAAHECAQCVFKCAQPAWADGAAHALARWATVVAGGYLQSAVTCVGSAGLQWVDFEPLRLPAQPMPAAAWLMHVAMAVLPIAFAVECWLQVRLGTVPRKQHTA